MDSYDLADDDMFDCDSCHRLLDIDESVKTPGLDLVCPDCAEDKATV